MLDLSLQDAIKVDDQGNIKAKDHLSLISDEYYPCQYCTKSDYCAANKAACKGYEWYIKGKALYGRTPGVWRFRVGMPTAKGLGNEDKQGRKEGKNAEAQTRKRVSRNKAQRKHTRAKTSVDDTQSHTRVAKKAHNERD